MKLPPKVYSANLNENGNTVFYLARKPKEGESQPTKQILLPHWLSDVINAGWKDAYWKGYHEARKQMRQAMGLQ